MSTDEATAGSSTPNSGTWFDTASDALRSGMSDAQKSAERFWPQVGCALSKGIFNIGYGLGYGFTFPSVLVARVIPQENPVVWGFIDGARVASDTAYRGLEAPSHSAT